MPKITQQERDQALAYLRKMLPPGSTVYTSLVSVSRSGMSRSIKALVADEGGAIENVSWAVARVTGNTFDRDRAAVKVQGAGMDMGGSLTYSVAYGLYPDGFTCTGDGCPSCDHSNGDRDYTPHHHRDGGYALRHSWL